MIRKPIPSEVIVDLYHKLSNLSAKHPDRKLLINETAKAFDVSFSTVRRAIKNYSQPRAITRSDYNCPRNLFLNCVKWYNLKLYFNGLINNAIVYNINGVL